MTWHGASVRKQPNEHKLQKGQDTYTWRDDATSVTDVASLLTYRPALPGSPPLLEDHRGSACERRIVPRSPWRSHIGPPAMLLAMPPRGRGCSSTRFSTAASSMLKVPRALVRGLSTLLITLLITLLASIPTVALLACLLVWLDRYAA